MKALVINGYAKKGRLTVALNHPEPRPAANQVKIRVGAAGINPLDDRIGSGDLRCFVPGQFPMVLGNDVAGEIVEIGADVRNFKVGDKVFCMLDANERASRRGFSKPGSYAQYAITRENTLCQIPETVDVISAAATPLAALTAYQTLRYIANAKPGQSLLVNGASGGVGTFAIQIAKAIGMEVTAVCSKANFSLVDSLGADRRVDYKSVDISAFQQKFDVIYDVIANQRYSKIKHLLKSEGSYISNVANGATVFSGVLNKLLSPTGIVRREYHAWVKTNGSDLREIGGMMSTGKVKPVVSRVFSLEDAEEAFELLRSGHTKGKLVFKLAD